MTSEEFRSNNELSQIWRREQSENSTLKIVFDLAIAEAPINQVPILTSPTASEFSYGRAYGWNECLNFMKNLGEQRRKHIQIPRTYGAPEE